MKLAIPLAVVFASVSCASTPVHQATPEEIAAAQRVQAVRVTRNSEATKGCKFLGNVAPEKIVQIGEHLDAFQQDFRVIPSFQHLKTLSG